MAQTRPAPAAGPVPDPGGPSWPLNTARGNPIGNAGGATSPAAASQPIMRPGTSLPLNTPRNQTAPQLSGSSPAPAVQAVGSGPGGASLPTASQPATVGGVLGGGMMTPPVVGTVTDPGAARCVIGQTQTVGMPADRAVVAGGDPSALGTGFSAADADAPTWSQYNISGNPNPGALSGGMAQIPGLYPGETPISQVSPQANPNPGAL